MMEYYSGIFIWAILVVVSTSMGMAIYSTVKHFNLKERQMKLEEEKVELERRKLDKQE